MKFCLGCGEIHKEGECRAGPDDTSCDLTPVQTGVETIVPSLRLNPVCPVCGEDEPEMRLEIRAVSALSVLFCTCRRCRWGYRGAVWTVKPLSRPWEGAE